MSSVLLALSTSGCAAAPDAVFEDPPEWADAPRFEGVVDFEIGDSDAPGPYLFSRIFGLALDGEGRIYLAEAQADEVRVFAPDGEHLFSIGRSGSGPGELKGPSSLGFDPAGRLWVRDGGNARYNAYELEDDGARHVATIRMAHSDGYFGAQLTFSDQGRLIDIGHTFGRRPTDRTISRFHLDANGATVRTEQIRTPSTEEQGGREVQRTQDGARSILFLWPPFRRTQLLAHAPGGGWAEAVSDRYEIAWYGADQTDASRSGASDTESYAELRHTLRRHLPVGPPVSPDERKEAEERLRREAEWAGLPGGASPFSVPERKQPLAALFFDHDGRLWVQRASAAGEPARADIYAPDGTPFGEVTWPRGVSLSLGAIRGDRAVGIAYDEMGVPRVVVLQLEAR